MRRALTLTPYIVALLITVLIVAGSIGSETVLAQNVNTTATNTTTTLIPAETITRTKAATSPTPTSPPPAGLKVKAERKKKGFWEELWEKYPAPTATIIAIAAFLLFYLYSNKRPAFPGKIVGYLYFLGMVPEGYYRKFYGLFVDIKNLITDEALRFFIDEAKKYVEEELGRDVSEEKKKVLKKVKEKLEKFNPSDLLGKIQVYGTRRDFIKYIYVVVGAEKPIEQYAIPSRFVNFEWAFLTFIRRLIIFGLRYDLPHWYVVKPYGRAKVSIFVPLFDPEEVKMRNPDLGLDYDTRDALAVIAACIRSALKFAYEKKHYLKEVRAAKDRLIKALKENAKLAKELDECRLALSAKTIFPVEKEKEAAPVTERYFELAISMLSFQALGVLMFPRLLQVDAVVSGFAGSLLGAFIFIMLRGKMK